jgi:hypothetical protein
MVGYPKMTGIMGGEPLMHPQFEELCKYAQEMIPKTQLGLWTCLPLKYIKYREIICETFGHIFVNDHSRDDIYHCPLLVGLEEVYSTKEELFFVADKCWVQNYWSASINPKGAFFCEIAAAMSLLLDGPKGWEVENGWWWRTPKDFTSQIEEWCPKCGAALPLMRRKSIDGRDDISPKWLERLKDTSPKIQRGTYVVTDFKFYKKEMLDQMGAYKDIVWRRRVSNKWGIYLVLNNQGFCTPVLRKSFSLGKESA